MLVVVLQAAMMLLLQQVISVFDETDAQSSMLPVWASFLLGVGMVLCTILWQMLYLGFLKTAAVYENQPQQPMDLLRFGRPYFWKILFFRMILEFALMILTVALTSVVGVLVWKGREFDKLPQWLPQICTLVGILILLKPMLLVPARMIVYDDTAFQAFSQIPFYQFNGISGIFKVISVGFGVMVLSTLLISFLKPESPVYYIFSGLHHIIFSFITLTLTLIAVLCIQQQFDAEQINMNEEENGE